MLLLDAANNLTATSPTVPTSLGVAILSAYVMHILKVSSKIPWISFYSTKVNAGLRVLLSGIGTLGISLKWAASSTGGGTVAISIPALTVILAGLWHWAVQYGIQDIGEGILQQRQQVADGAQPKP